MPAARLYFADLRVAICGVGEKRTGLKPSVNFAILTFGEWTERMVGNIQERIWQRK